VKHTAEQERDRRKWEDADISELIGKTLVSVEGYEADGEVVVMTTDDGARYHFFHEQDCCESVGLTDVDAGEFKNIIGEKVCLAERVEFSPPTNTYGDTSTWTFYKVGSDRWTAVMRWHGVSNGYYSESVTLKREPEAVPS